MTIADIYAETFKHRLRVVTGGGRVTDFPRPAVAYHPGPFFLLGWLFHGGGV